MELSMLWLYIAHLFRTPQEVKKRGVQKVANDFFADFDAESEEEVKPSPAQAKVTDKEYGYEQKLYSANFMVV